MAILSRCPKCGGNLYFESDLGEGFLLRKCLQCGLIESYFWLERTSRSLVNLPPEDDKPVTSETVVRQLTLTRDQS